MTDSHVCDYCSKRCSKKYNQDCEILKSRIMNLSRDDVDIIKSQIKILAVNLPPEEVSDIMFDVFFRQVCWRTSQNVMREFHEKIENVENWKIK